jgi:hypothetical protein
MLRNLKLKNKYIGDDIESIKKYSPKSCSPKSFAITITKNHCESATDALANMTRDEFKLSDLFIITLN